MAGNEDAETLRWSVRLWQKEPNKLMIIMAAAFLAAGAGIFFLQSPLGAGVGILLIAGATADFWMPVHFLLDGTKASRRCGISVTSIEWGDIKRVDVTDIGAKLSPLESSEARTEPFRGVFLRFENNRDQVIEAIRRCWNQDVRFVD